MQRSTLNPASEEIFIAPSAISLILMILSPLRPKSEEIRTLDLASAILSARAWAEKPIFHKFLQFLKKNLRFWIDFDTNFTRKFRSNFSSTCEDYRMHSSDSRASQPGENQRFCEEKFAILELRKRNFDAILTFLASNVQKSGSENPCSKFEIGLSKP